VGKLDTLNQQVRTCRLCRLCRTRLNGVPGDGNDRAEVLFIGEGPGFHEDREARPFVGPAGQFLDELLEIAGLRRPDVYITNVVKCRPPQNRDPLPDEIDACAPYLERQIATIDPVLIVTLGRFSMGRFFPNDKISSVHGQARQVEGRIVMTMWHPAYGLRDPRGRESLKDDFRKLPAVLEQARALRAERPAPAPRRQPDFSALVEEHLSALPVAPPPADAEAAAPPPAEAADAFAYLAAVNGKTRKAAGRRNGSAPAEPAPAAEPIEPVVAEEPAPIAMAEPGELAVAEEPATVIYAPAPMEQAAVTGDGLAPVVEAAPAAPSEAAPPARPHRSRAAKAKPAEVTPSAQTVAPAPDIVNPETVVPAPDSVAAAGETPEVEIAAAAGAVTGETPESEGPPAPPAKGAKKAKPEPEVKQLSLF
jgi:DNA polymerase